MRLRVLLFVLAAYPMTTPALADEFGRLEGDRLAKIAKGEGATKHASLSFSELSSLPDALKDNRSALLVVKTDQDNLAKLLVSPALKKTPGHEDQLRSVLVIERLETFERGKAGKRLARSEALTVFDGFAVDLDTGQVVPASEGEDLIFSAGKPGEGTLKAVGSAEVWTVNATLAEDVSKNGPSPGRAILPADFNGRYQLEADGRWKGLLELTVNAEKHVTGQFRSEPNGTSYPVEGQVANDVPHKIFFSIKFPRTEQEFDGYLATQGKMSLAGTFLMENRTFGFHAERETNPVPKTDAKVD